MSIIKHVQLTLLASSHQSANAARRRQRQNQTQQRNAIHGRHEAQKASVEAQRNERVTKQVASIFLTRFIGEPLGTAIATGARNEKADQDKVAAQANISKLRAASNYEDAVDAEATSHQLEDGARTFLSEINQRETQKSEQR